MCIARRFCSLLLLAVIQIIFYVFYTFFLLDLARGLQIGSVNLTSFYCGIGSSGHVKYLRSKSSEGGKYGRLLFRTARRSVLQRAGIVSSLTVFRTTGVFIYVFPFERSREICGCH